jgi:hypothetical protein
MRMTSRGVRPRRGAWGLGSRTVKATAAACLAGLTLAAAAPPAAQAYLCGDATPPSMTRQLSGISPDECRVPEQLRRDRPKERTEKKGSMSTLTVFVVAVVAVLLIPIGRNGLPHGGDPFGRDLDELQMKPRIK